MYTTQPRCIQRHPNVHNSTKKVHNSTQVYTKVPSEHNSTKMGTQHYPSTYKSTQVYTTALNCAQQYLSVHNSTQVHMTVTKCTQTTQVYSQAYTIVPQRIHNSTVCTLEYFSVHMGSTHVYTKVLKCTQHYSSVHNSIYIKSAHNSSQ